MAVRPIHHIAPLLSDEALRVDANARITDIIGIAKALVENAVDATATMVMVTVIGGDSSGIIVEDNGHGVAATDLEGCAQKFCTSKLQPHLSVRNTYGIAGLNLAGIRCVSKSMCIESRDRGVGFDHGNGPRIYEISQLDGFRIIVQNPFYRRLDRGVLSNRSLEASCKQIRTIMQAVALACPSCRFVLRRTYTQRRDSSIFYESPSAGDARLGQVLGPTYCSWNIKGSYPSIRCPSEAIHVRLEGHHAPGPQHENRVVIVNGLVTALKALGKQVSRMVARTQDVPACHLVLSITLDPVIDDWARDRLPFDCLDRDAEFLKCVCELLQKVSCHETPEAIGSSSMELDDAMSATTAQDDVTAPEVTGLPGGDPYERSKRRRQGPPGLEPISPTQRCKTQARSIAGTATEPAAFTVGESQRRGRLPECHSAATTRRLRNMVGVREVSRDAFPQVALHATGVLEDAVGQAPAESNDIRTDNRNALPKRKAPLKRSRIAQGRERLWDLGCYPPPIPQTAGRNPEDGTPSRNLSDHAIEDLIPLTASRAHILVQTPDGSLFEIVRPQASESEVLCEYCSRAHELSSAQSFLQRSVVDVEPEVMISDLLTLHNAYPQWVCPHGNSIYMTGP